MQKKQTKVITVFGPTGDIGSQLAKYLIHKKHKTKLIVRIGSEQSLQIRVPNYQQSQVLKVASVFNLDILNKLLSQSKIIYNMSGMVSLSFAPKIYPSVLLINTLFPGFLAFLNRKTKIPIVYASTQRMITVPKSPEIDRWVEQAVKSFNQYISLTHKKRDFENTSYLFIKRFIKSNPVPDGINIYDLSKEVAEKLMSQDNHSVILRVSSCYGPGCSARRTIGRLIFSRIAGLAQNEMEEIRDYVFIEDMAMVLEKLMHTSYKKAVTLLCCSGVSTSKSNIINRILKQTPGQKGSLSVTKRKLEVFRPSGIWFKTVLGKDPTPLDEGIGKTISFIKSQFFSKKSMSIHERFNTFYDSLKQKADEQGVNAKEVEEKKRDFFIWKNGRWQAKDIFWKPTLIVLGYPFDNNLLNSIGVLRQTVLDELNVGDQNCWMLDDNLLHLTVAPYSHYFDPSSPHTDLPDSHLQKVREIVGRFKPMEVTLDGVVITRDGSFLIKGFVGDEDLVNLRQQLQSELPGITTYQPSALHLKVGQILTQVPYQKTEFVNRMFATYDLGRRSFAEVKTSSGLKIPFAKSAA